MEQKWFAWFDGSVLHLHRSWTGVCIFRVGFAPQGDGLRAVSVLVNREPAQYLETDDTADRRLVLEVIDGLFVLSPDERPLDSFAEAFKALAQPNYLGSPAVVSSLLHTVIEAAIAFGKREMSFTVVWDAVWTLSQEIASGEQYVRIPGWHTAGALGQRLCQCFAIPREPLFDGDLDHPVCEALMALFLKVRDMVLALEADPAATWNPHAPTRINALHDRAVTVFLGTSDLLHPSRTIDDFGWVEAGEG
ncbi:hypothetical protein [Rhodobacter sp. CZR27]|uniref:hypothetical protein n=1 Tax=Rhodobacter sp. CZR27 TaxID=2033869 RepID=UPI000BBE3368|nr:hypothetical protein [Rhodobacter sp. CZR27]